MASIAKLGFDIKDVKVTCPGFGAFDIEAAVP